jgi:hypothetical protein
MLGNASVTPGGSAALLSPGYIQLPSLQVTVFSGSSSLLPGSAVSTARVTARDTASGCNITRALTPAGGTNAAGQVPIAPPAGGDIGLPYGTYDVCASNAAKTAHRTVTGIALTSAGSTGTPLAIYLGAGTTSGNCP